MKKASSCNVCGYRSVCEDVRNNRKRCSCWTLQETERLEDLTSEQLKKQLRFEKHEKVESAKAWLIGLAVVTCSCLCSCYLAVVIYEEFGPSILKIVHISSGILLLLLILIYVLKTTIEAIITLIQRK